MKTQNTQHIGDGVYVSHDGYQLWIGANHHENMTVAIDPQVFLALIDYARHNMGWHIRELKPGPTSEADALRAENERLRAALEPFAQVAVHHAADAPEWGPFDSVQAVISIRSLRAALGDDETNKGT